MSSSSSSSSSSEVPDDGTLSDAVMEFLTAQSAEVLSTVTMKTLKVALEAKFGCELDSRKAVLKECLANFVVSYSSQSNPQEGDANGGGMDDGIDGIDWGANDDDDFNAALADDGDLGLGFGDDDEADDEEVEERNSSKKKKGKGGGGFAAPVQLSTELSEFIGETVLSRTEVTKRIWDYIKANNLQDPKDRRNIVCDATFEKLFKKKSFGMFKMTKFLSLMMKSVRELQEGLEVVKAEKKVKVKAEKKVKEEKEDKSTGSKKRKAPAASSKAPKSAAKKAKKSPASGSGSGSGSGGTGGLNKPMKLSSQLAGILGCAEASRPQVVKKMWEYIKGKEMQDPKYVRVCVCVVVGVRPFCRSRSVLILCAFCALCCGGHLLVTWSLTVLLLL
jgi:upstream activation factor subunit UAF30